MNMPYPFTRGVQTLLIVNGIVFLLQLFPGTGQWLAGTAALIPEKTFAHCQLWRLGTYMFLHSTVVFLHLLLNMLALWMFGGELEGRWGTGRFLRLYFLFGAGAALFGVFYLLDPGLRLVPVIGASGAVFGLLTAFAVYYPDRIVLLFFVLPVRAWMIAAGFAVFSLMFAWSQGDGVAHLVHLGGIVTAFAYLKVVPKACALYRSLRELRLEKEMRTRAEDRLGRKRYYEEKVDPLLKKISEKGEHSLTEEDKKTLRDVWKYK
ncbi:MAG: rhomboid family intramembrane serine protease [Chitinispirillaceae bacterium]|nr:rhomboid family intramembrane serine protease [Chitinispirillaceae bacterium]